MPAPALCVLRISVWPLRGISIRVPFLVIDQLLFTLMVPIFHLSFLCKKLGVFTKL